VQEKDLLLEIDPVYFSGTESINVLIRSWFKDKLDWELPLEFNSLEMILVMAVQSDRNDFFIQKMQLLDINTQIELKNIIQDCLNCRKVEENLKENREIRDLKLDLETVQGKLLEKEEEILNLKKKIKEFVKKTENVKENEQELEFLNEKLQKMTSLLEKYKKKLQNTESVKELKDVVLEKSSQILELKEELRRNQLQKEILENYKSKITKLEKKSLEKEEEVKVLELESRKLQEKYDRIKKEKEEECRILNERIIEISNLKVKEEENSGTLGEVEKIQELSGQVLDLTKEIQKFKDLLLLEENKLDDMNRLKNAFEQDYRKTLQENSRVQKENLKLLKELEDIQDESCQKKLNQTVQLYQELKIVKEEQDQKLETLTEQVKVAQEESRSKHGQVNSLLQEKEALESKLEKFRERANTTDQLLAETKASWTAQESRNEGNDVNTKLASATQKIVQLTDQNALLHQALRKAKNHILMLDKTIKDERSLKMHFSDQNPYAEAIHSFETQIAEKNTEINRLRTDLKDLKESTKREEELMSTAWYNLCTTLQPQDIDKLASDIPWLQLKRNSDLS
jgi:protein HOOK3